MRRIKAYLEKRRRNSERLTAKRSGFLLGFQRPESFPRSHSREFREFTRRGIKHV